MGRFRCDYRYLKDILFFLSIIIVSCFITGCTAYDTGRADVPDDMISIVTTIFPEYDWVKNVLGDNPAKAELTMLLDNGVDMHSYQPSADDILKISACDMFVYVGGESDEWVEDVFTDASNPDMVVINLMDILGDNVREEETVEGMQDSGPEEETEEEEYDEHVWLSLRNAELIVDSIAGAMEQIDEANAQIYRSNADSYIDKLRELDEKYKAETASAPNKTLLFGDRFPFRYLVDDYGLSYYAAFAGCSAETEASFNTIVFLSEKADELKLGTVLTIDGDDTKIAETICKNMNNPDTKILILDSLQSTTIKDAEKGVSYLSVMENNLSILKEALD